MTTFAFKPGASGPLTFQPRQPDLTAPDLAGAAMQLRVDDGAACRTLPGVLRAADALFEVDVSSLSDLAPGLYEAWIWMNWGLRWVREDEDTVNLEILGGC